MTVVVILMMTISSGEGMGSAMAYCHSIPGYKILLSYYLNPLYRSKIESKTTWWFKGRVSDPCDIIPLNRSR